MSQTAGDRGGSRSAPASPIRLIALDVDGTLLDPTGTVRPRVSGAITAAIEGGCTVVLATGRRLPSVAPLAQRLGITTLILTDGTVVFDLQEGRAIYEQCLLQPSLRQAVDLAVGIGLPPVLFESPASAGRVLVGPPSLDNPETLYYLGRRAEVVRLALSEIVRATRIVGVIAMGERALVDQLATHQLASASFETVVWRDTKAGYQYHTVSFAPANTSKGIALEWLADRLDISLEATMAVGDYLNDVSLIAAAGWGVAMGNAVEAVRGVARAFVADNEHDGVAEAIERWVLGA